MRKRFAVPPPEPARETPAPTMSVPLRARPGALLPAGPTAPAEPLPTFRRPFTRPAELKAPPQRSTTPANPRLPVASPHASPSGQPPKKKKQKPRKPRAGNEIAHNEFRPHVLARDRLRVWSAPFARDHDTLFRLELPDDLVNQTYTTLFAAYAPNTHSNYASGLLRFHQWCDSFELPERARMPASHFLLAAFIAAFVGTVGGGTVKSWMSGLKAWHDINGAPWLGEDRWVELARRTANKEGAHFKREQRGPVTIEHLRALRKVLDLAKPFDAAVWALACAAFWGCRRLGELTIPSRDAFDPALHVRRDVARKKISANNGATSATSLHLPWTKTTREVGGTLTLTGRPDAPDLCPERALENHLFVNANVPDDAPLFAFTVPGGGWSPMTKAWFMQRCDKIWKDTDLLRVFGHSFRIGGSTELLLAGVPCEVVAAQGGWTSLAFLLYWRKVEHIIPSHIGKAYDKKKFDELAKSFESFRIANKIIIHDSTDEL